MLSTLRTSAIIAIALVHVVGCKKTENADDALPRDGGSSDPDGASTKPAGDGMAPNGPDLGECVPYAPRDISGTKSGNFASAGEVVKIALPETDVGGGLLKVTYVTDKQPLVGSIWLGEGALKDVPRHETAAFGPKVSDVTSAVVYYRLAGKKIYEIGVQPFSFDEGAANNYTVTYSYEAQLDCYEANDTRDAAKRVPLNQAITAALHTGIGPDDSDTVNATGDDWYTFDLAEPRAVRLTANLPGKDGPDGKNSAFFSVLTADGGGADCGGGQGSFETDPVSPTEAVQTCEGTLAAGKYFVKLGHFVSQTAVTKINVAPDKSWNTPYNFTIEAK